MSGFKTIAGRHYKRFREAPCPVLKRDGIIRQIFQIFFGCGAFVMLIFIAVSGRTGNLQLQKTLYWIKADDLGGSSAEIYWTWWGLLYTFGSQHGFHQFQLFPGCPFSPYDNYRRKVLFSYVVTMPTDFVKRRDVYYYLGRFTFPCVLITLCLLPIAVLLMVFVQVLPIPCMAISHFLSFLCFWLILIAAVFQTTVVGLGNTAFFNANITAHVGSVLLGLIWGSAVILFIISILGYWETIQMWRGKGGSPSTTTDRAPPPPNDAVEESFYDKGQYDAVTTAEKTIFSQDAATLSSRNRDVIEQSIAPTNGGNGNGGSKKSKSQQQQQSKSNKNSNKGSNKNSNSNKNNSNKTRAKSTLSTIPGSVAPKSSHHTNRTSHHS